MANSQNVNVSGGTSGLTLLGIVFVVLKLTGVIDWSWWLVTLPFWGGLALFVIGILVFLVMALLGAGVMAATGDFLDRRAAKARRRNKEKFNNK